MKIELGAMAPSIQDQLEDTGMSSKTLQEWDRLAFYITYLNLHCVLSDAETRKAQVRLVKIIQKELRTI